MLMRTIKTGNYRQLHLDLHIKWNNKWMNAWQNNCCTRKFGSTMTVITQDHNGHLAATLENEIWTIICWQICSLIALYNQLEFQLKIHLKYEKRTFDPKMSKVLPWNFIKSPLPSHCNTVIETQLSLGFCQGTHVTCWYCPQIYFSKF